MKFKWNSMKFDKIQMKFKFILMTIQVQFNENSMKIQWKFNENSMKIRV